MVRRSQYRCSFKSMIDELQFDGLVERCKEKMAERVRKGMLCNASFYKYESMGFLYIEEIVDDENAGRMDIDSLMADIRPFLKPWPREEGDRFFAPMINVYYHHIPEEDLDAWEYERTTEKKTRVGRVAFVFPDKLTSYLKHHIAIVEEGLLKGDKYAFISMHENLLFSYYEEPRNNVNIRGIEEESETIKKWLEVDPESHFDRVKAKGDNFLVIPCLFTVDRVDF